MERRLTTDPDRSRLGNLAASGDDSAEPGGEGDDGPLVSEMLLSTTEGDLECSRPAALRTAKKVEAGRALGTASAVTTLPESFWSAWIR